MSYTARKLITEAYYASGIRSREFQTIEGSLISEGLSLLNDFLAVTTAQQSKKPYIQTKVFNCVIGQEKYEIEGLIYAETISFYIADNLRLPVRILGRQDYFGSAKVTDLNTIPYNCNIERVLNGSEVYFYPLPDKTYKIEITGFFSLDFIENLSLDLTTVYDMYYIVYLKHNLIKNICMSEAIQTPPETIEYISQLDNAVAKIAMIDLNKKPRKVNYNDAIYMDMVGGFTGRGRIR